jgi:hypothetical protein
MCCGDRSMSQHTFVAANVASHVWDLLRECHVSASRMSHNICVGNARHMRGIRAGFRIRCAHPTQMLRASHGKFTKGCYFWLHRGYSIIQYSCTYWNQIVLWTTDPAPKYQTESPINSPNKTNRNSRRLKRRNTHPSKSPLAAITRPRSAVMWYVGLGSS